MISLSIVIIITTVVIVMAVITTIIIIFLRQSLEGVREGVLDGYLLSHKYTYTMTVTNRFA